jgi:hypothetical protein
MTRNSPAKRNSPFFLGFWNYRQKMIRDFPKKEIPLPVWVGFWHPWQTMTRASCLGFWHLRQKITRNSPAKRKSPSFLGFWNYRQTMTLVWTLPQKKSPILS